MAQSSGDFSPLAQLVCYSDNLEDALDRYVEYVGYFNSGFSVACLPKPQELIYPVYNTDIDPQECSAFRELRIATCRRLIRLITGEQTPDIIAEVGFQHSANAEACKYEEILQSPVFFEHEYSHFSVKRSMLNRPVLSRNKILLQHTLDNVRARITADNSSSNDIIIRVRSLIRSRLERKQFSQRDIAEKMDMSTSTLKRLLDAFNVNFQFLLDQERRYVAEQLLQRGEVFMEDIAIKTGYSSSAAFTRGYTRITGITPNQYRWNIN
jgi:transcriptional regulator GlxA family with amidase domain